MYFLSFLSFLFYLSLLSFLFLNLISFPLSMNCDGFRLIFHDYIILCLSIIIFLNNFLVYRFELFVYLYPLVKMFHFKIYQFTTLKVLRLLRLIHNLMVIFNRVSTQIKVLGYLHNNLPLYLLL